MKYCLTGTQLSPILKICHCLIWHLRSAFLSFSHPPSPSISSLPTLVLWLEQPRARKVSPDIELLTREATCARPGSPFAPWTRSTGARDFTVSGGLFETITITRPRNKSLSLCSLSFLSLSLYTLCLLVESSDFLRFKLARGPYSFNATFGFRLDWTKKPRCFLFFYIGRALKVLASRKILSVVDRNLHCHSCGVSGEKKVTKHQHVDHNFPVVRSHVPLTSVLHRKYKFWFFGNKSL